MIAAKVRADSFAAALDPVQAWALYDYHYKTAKGKMDLSLAWAESEFEGFQKPGHTAFHDWLKKMHELEGVHAREVRELCEQKIEESARSLKVRDETAIRAAKAEALDAGVVEGDWDKAKLIMELVHGIEDAAFKQAEIDLKSRAQKTKDDQLRLAREKFEFDAAKKAMELAAEIKSVAADDSLDDDEKIAKVREALFG